MSETQLDFCCFFCMAQHPSCDGCCHVCNANVICEIAVECEVAKPPAAVDLDLEYKPGSRIK